MHDHAPILDDRVHRHLAEKIRPAETTTVCHLNVEWAPVTDTVEGLNSRPGVVGQGEPISISAGLALAYELPDRRHMGTAMGNNVVSPHRDCTARAPRRPP
ncbi:alpha-mannosidase [Cutibacterium acnes JCM 18916]|nr:alpha-mannosidase [Cutibacterium acnes JCM 18916]